MEEFGTEFDRMVESGIVLGEDASANAVASFDNLDAQSGPREVDCSGKTGYAGPKDEDVGHEEVV
jgi:hypothetical protein